MTTLLNYKSCQSHYQKSGNDWSISVNQSWTSLLSYPQELISCYGELLHKYDIVHRSEHLGDKKSGKAQTDISKEIRKTC